MKQFLRIKPLWTFSCRLASKTSNPDVAAALKQFNRENKLRYGKLIETAKSKSAIKAGKSKVSRANQLQMSSLSAEETGILASVSSDRTKSDASTKKKKSETIIASDNDTKSSNVKDDSISRKKKSSKPKQVNSTAESSGEVKSSLKRTKKSSKSSSELAESSCEGEPVLKKKKTRKVKSMAPISSSNETKMLEQNTEIIQAAKEEQIEKPDLAADNSRINVFVEKSTQSNDVSSSETNENVTNESTFYYVEDDSETTSTSNPYNEYTLLNKFKKTYSPDLKYVETNMISPTYYPYPSVAHILSESMSPSSETYLKRWKDNLISELGDDEFKVYSASLMHSAKSLRKLILLRLRGNPESKIVIPPELQGCWESLKFIFPLFPKVKEIGKITVHPELKYKGMIDSLIEFRNKLVLVSWKKANKYVPSLDKTYDLPIQCAAYMGAINADPSFPFLVDEALLVMSYTNGMKADVFHVKADQCEKYWKLWLDRLHTFQQRAKKTEVKDISKSDLGKLNIEEELAKIHEKNTDISEKKAESSPVIVSKVEESIDNARDNSTKVEESIDNTLVASEDFPLLNEEKSSYTDDQKYDIGSIDQTVFNHCPAVTTILSQSKSAASKFILEQWKNNLIAELGVEGFETYQKNLLSSGVSFHKFIQNHLQGNFQDIPAEVEGCWKSLQPVLPLIKDVKLTESKVVHEKLHYKGVIDCVAKFNDKLVVIDWKKSDKPKSTISMTYDAPLQIAAYIGAINFDSNYPFKVEEGLLVISYVDGAKADVYHLNAENCQKYWEQWLQRLRKYQLEANANCQKIEY